MHLESEEEITLLEFEEAEEGNQQEDPQAAAPEGVEQNRPIYKSIRACVISSKGSWEK